MKLIYVDCWECGQLAPDQKSSKNDLFGDRKPLCALDNCVQDSSDECGKPDAGRKCN